MDSPSAERNKNPIWNVICSDLLPKLNANQSLQFLEIAAGAGVHTIFFTEKMREALPNKEIRWIASDPDTDSLSSIQTRVQVHPDTKLKSSIDMPPKKLTLDRNGFTEKVDFQTEQTDVMICINMIHISPWEATMGLMKEASRHLKAGSGYLYCYGPYLEGGKGAASNLQFSLSLKSRNPAWGVRNVEDVVTEAEKNGLVLDAKIEMPRENLSLIFHKL